jgi:hypothetical protein
VDPLAQLRDAAGPESQLGAHPPDVEPAGHVPQRRRIELADQRDLRRCVRPLRPEVGEVSEPQPVHGRPDARVDHRVHGQVGVSGLTVTSLGVSVP